MCMQYEWGSKRHRATLRNESNAGVFSAILREPVMWERQSDQCARTCLRAAPRNVQDVHRTRYAGCK